MKWPTRLTLIRHGESKYNALKAKKAADPLYQEFLSAYLELPKDVDHCRELAQRVMDGGTVALNLGDENTPLTPRGHSQARTVGQSLKSEISLPDVVFVSPYLRTHETVTPPLYIAQHSTTRVSTWQ